MTHALHVHMQILTFPYVVLALQPIVLQLQLLKHCQDLQIAVQPRKVLSTIYDSQLV